MATISFWRKLGLVRPSDQTPIIRKIKLEQELGKVYFASQTFAKDCLLWTDVHLRRNVTNVPGFRLKPIRKLLRMARQPNRIRADTRNASCCTEREKITSTFLPIFCFLSQKKCWTKWSKVDIWTEYKTIALIWSFGIAAICLLQICQGPSAFIFKRNWYFPSIIDINTVCI